jgi:hypothetical protein
MTEEDCLSLYPLADQELLDGLIRVYKNPKILEEHPCLFLRTDSEVYKRTTVADAISEGGELSIRAYFNDPELDRLKDKTPEDSKEVHAILRAWSVVDGEFYKQDFVLKPILSSSFWGMALVAIDVFATLYRSYLHNTLHLDEEANRFADWFNKTYKDCCMNFALKTYRTAGDRARR